MRTVEKRCEMRKVVRPARQRAEALEDGVLGLGVERGGGLVEHQDVGLLAHEGARERDLLPLAARELDAVVRPLAELGAEPRRRARPPPRRRRRAPPRAIDARLLGQVRHAADADVLAHVELVLVEVLEDDADARRAASDRIPVAQVDAVEEDAPLGRLVEARQQLDERGLAGAVLPDQRHRLPVRDEEADVAQRPRAPAVRCRCLSCRRRRIAEADVVEADALFARGRRMRGAGSGALARPTGIARYSNRFDM